MSIDGTASLAKKLWDELSSTLCPDEFQARFDEIYRRAEGPATLWRLGGAANDYLRKHPDSVRVPCELAPALLASSLVDARIIGLKLLIRTSQDWGAIHAELCRALESRHVSTRLGGLCELHNALHRCGKGLPMPKGDLVSRLEKLRQSSDEHVRETATRLTGWLDELPSERDGPTL
jgi:hypothetical protein